MKPALGQLVGHLLRGALGAGEDHRRAPAIGLQDPADQFYLVQRVGAIDELLGGVMYGQGMRGLGANMGGLVHEGAGQRDDRVRHGRREQHRLPLGGDLTQDALDVGQEAEVQHFVGLVEHQYRQPAELQVALLAQIEQPARGAHHDVGAGAQRVDLWLVGPSAVNGHHRQPAALFGGQEFGRGGQVPGDLQAQLPGRHHDQGPWCAIERPYTDAVGDALQQRNAEGEGLAHAGAGLADHIVAGKGERQGQFLDSKGVLDAFFG